MFALRRVATRNLFAIPRMAAAVAPRMASTTAEKNLLKALNAELEHDSEIAFPTEDMAQFFKNNSTWKFSTEGAKLKLVRSVDGYDVTVNWRAVNPSEFGEESGMGVAFEVIAAKPGKGSVVFNCETVPVPEGEQQQNQEEAPPSMWIQNVRFLAEGESVESEIAYEGPSFMDLDETLQDSLDGLLGRLVGDYDEFIDFVEGASADYEENLYNHWLKNLKTFIQ